MRGKLVEPTTHMSPAEGEAHVTAACQCSVTAIAVDLQDACKSGEMFDRPLASAIRRVAIGDRWRIGPAPGPVVADIGPELPCLRTPTSRIEDWCGGLICKQPAASLELDKQMIAQWRQPPRRATRPVGERRTVETDALPGINLRLAI